MKTSWHSLIPFLPFLLKSSSSAIPRTRPNSIPSRLLLCLYSPALPNTFYNHSAWTPWKTPSSTVKNSCLLVRYLAMDVLILSRERVVGMCLPTRCLTMGIHVTILLLSFCFSVGTSCFQYSVVSWLCYVVSSWRGTIVSYLRSTRIFCSTWYCVTSVDGGLLPTFLKSMV
jgi:hypothetical protein